MKPDTGRELSFLPAPPAFDAPVRGGPCLNTAITFGIENPEWFGYWMVKKSEDMFTDYDKIHERDEWTGPAPVALSVASRYVLPGYGDWRVWIQSSGWPDHN